MGTIVDAPTAALFINLGADFIVGPMFNRDIVELCNRRKIAYVPGCATLTEISQAEAAGVELVKIFPGSVLGPAFVKAVKGPQPWSRMVVTGGVTPTQAGIQEWFGAGAAAVGIGSQLIRPDWIQNGRYDELENLTGRVVRWIAEARQD